MNKPISTPDESLDNSNEVHGFILDTLELALLNERCVSEDDPRVVGLVDVTADNVLLNYDGQLYSIHVRIEPIQNSLTAEQSYDSER